MLSSGGEMANAVDSKSTGSDTLRVQVPFWAPFKKKKNRVVLKNTILFFVLKMIK